MRYAAAVLILVAGCTFDTSGPAEPGSDTERDDELGPSPIVCPTGYSESATGSCYRLEVERDSWTAAETACETDGGHLVVVDDDFENQVLGELIADEEVWIGLQRERETSFRWVTGDEPQYFSWESDAPDDQQCVILRNDNSPSGWDDKDCPDSYAFVCEIDA